MLRGFIYFSSQTSDTFFQLHDLLNGFNCFKISLSSTLTHLATAKRFLLIIFLRCRGFMRWDSQASFGGSKNVIETHVFAESTCIKLASP